MESLTPEQQAELEQINSHLLKLDRLEEFRTWRDKVVCPILRQVKNEKRKALEMSEANLKAIVMYENFLEELFSKIFEDVRVIDRIEQEAKEKK